MVGRVQVGGGAKLAELPLIGATGYDLDHPLGAYNPHGPDAVIDQDVLWSCTTCGACVEQCPVNMAIRDKKLKSDHLCLDLKPCTEDLWKTLP
jgi:ferredoxin